jgi:osmotically-inducible protein OsmY
MFYQRGPDSFPGGIEAFVSMTLGVLAIFLFVVILLTASAHAAQRPDAWITAKVKLALLTAPEIGAMGIDVDTDGGKVTLHGTVASESESGAAEQIARDVAGVTDVRNLLAVVPEPARPALRGADAAVRERVEGALRAAAALRQSSVHVKSVNDGVVVLAGRAESLGAHLAAVEVARSVDGVRGVASEIESPDAVSDADIWRAGKPAATGTSAALSAAAADAWTGADVKTRLFASEAPATAVDVDAEDGVVTLFGIVPTEDEKQAAEAAAAGALGVRRVDNALEVVSGNVRGEVERRDRSLERAVSVRFAEHPDLAGQPISVAVRNGVARISGRVARPEDGLLALELGRGTPGIRSVLDDLEVAPREAGAK